MECITPGIAAGLSKGKACCNFNETELVKGNCRVSYVRRYALIAERYPEYKNYLLTVAALPAAFTSPLIALARRELSLKKTKNALNRTADLMAET